MAALRIVLQSITAGWFALRAFAVTAESLIMLPLNSAACCATLLFSLPVAGFLLHLTLRMVHHFVAGILLPLEAALYFCGIVPEKRLRIRIVILRDENGQPACRASDLLPQLLFAMRVYKEQANVAIVPARLSLHRGSAARSGFISRSFFAIDDGMMAVDLSANLGRGRFGRGRRLLNLKSCRWCFGEQWRRLVGYGAPVTVFVTAAANGPFLGWHLGPPGEYALLMFRPEMAIGEYSAVLAHEIGHVCTLRHSKVPDNLMNRHVQPLGGSELQLARDQVIALRVSPHTTCL